MPPVVLLYHVQNSILPSSGTNRFDGGEQEEAELSACIYVVGFVVGFMYIRG